MNSARHPEIAALLRDRYEAADLDALAARLQAWGTLDLPALPNGLYPAVTGDAAGRTGYAATWVRDNVHIAHAQLACGDTQGPAVTARTLVRWFSTQVPRMQAILEGTADLDDPMQRPHIRFDGERLAELDVWWPHAQNDALGAALWWASRTALMGLFDPSAEELGILRLMVRTLEALPYWTDRDSGHWEEHRKRSASSIGVVVAGLRAFQLLIHKPRRAGQGGTGDPARRYGGNEQAVEAESQRLDHLIEHGEAALRELLPREAAGEDDPARNRTTDAALLFLIEPFGVVDDDVADGILEAVCSELMGPHGIRRYAGDSYWMADYEDLFDEDTRTGGFAGDHRARDAALKPGTEAQWCLFDPLISVVWGKRWLRTGAEDDRRRQTLHFNRALGQLTGPQGAVTEGLCAEAYCLRDSAVAGDAGWQPNDNTPLLWTAAHLAWAFALMRRVTARAPASRGGAATGGAPAGSTPA